MHLFTVSQCCNFFQVRMDLLLFLLGHEPQKVIYVLFMIIFPILSIVLVTDVRYLINVHLTDPKRR